MSERNSSLPWLALVGLAVVYCGLAASLPALDDEIYYWCWAQKPQLSYFDHAPLAAYMIYASTACLGDSLLAIRFPAVIANLVVICILYNLMQPKLLWPYVVCTPLFTLGAVIITPDTPLLLFWMLYLYWMVKVQSYLDNNRDDTDQKRRTIPLKLWLLGGLILGLGGLGKYTMVLAVPTGFLAFFMGSPRRMFHWLPGYLLHGMVAFILTLPVFYFNYCYQFEPLRYQWNHANLNQVSGIKTLISFIGTQSLLFGFLPILLLPWVLLKIKTLIADSTMRICVVFYLLPMLFFLYKACCGPLEGNWALVAYLGFWPVAARWHGVYLASRWQLPVRMLGLGIPFVLSFVALVHLIYPLPLVKPQQDRMIRQWSRMAAAREAVEILKSAAPGVPVYTPTYQWTALLNYAGADCYQLRGITRPSHFTLPGQLPDHTDEIIIWNETTLPDGMLPTHEFTEEIFIVPIVVRGEVVTCMRLLRYQLKYQELPPSALLGGVPHKRNVSLELISTNKD